MKQLLILSGKGGTGKTTIASAFIKLAKAQVYGDCDVDAPNLHLIMNQTSQPKGTDFYGMAKSEINTDLCIHCDLCRQKCKFNAISMKPNYHVDDYACEGCGVCEAICPVDAITLKPHISGKLLLYENNSIFSTAQLHMGSGNSGLLVTEVKKQLKSVPFKFEVAMIDGSPGIGCPVIASISGADIVLIITEPSLSGISDLKRIIRTSEQFNTKIGVCINKYDINIDNTDKIESLCQKLKIPLVGRIPYDTEAVHAINLGISIVDLECKSGRAVKNVFEQTMKLFFHNTNEDNKKESMKNE